MIRSHSPTGYFQKMYEIIPQKNITGFTPDEAKSYTSDMRKRFSSLLGVDSIPLKTDSLSPQVIMEERKYDGYTLQRYEITICDELIQPVYLLIPEDVQEPVPGVVALSGHGYGCADICGIEEDGSDRGESDSGYQKNFAIEICKRGFVVAVPELIGFGDMRMSREQSPGEGNSCYPYSTTALMYGLNMSGLRVYQALRTVDFLQSLPLVNSKSIGSMGISGGGLVSAFLAVLDERISACVSSGYVCSFKDSIMAMHHCVDNYIPGVLSSLGEMENIVSAIAPRPLLMESGTKDNIFPIEASKKAVGEIRKFYRIFRAEDKLYHDIFEGEHQISGAMAYDFLEKYLK